MNSEKEYTITGMDCADCARHVADAVQRVQGIREVDVNFMTGRLRIAAEVNPGLESDIAVAVRKAGYSLQPDQHGAGQNRFYLPEMDCADEVNLIRKKMENLPGIHSLDFNLIRKELSVTHTLTAPELIKYLRGLGFHPVEKNNTVQVTDSGEARVNGQRTKLIISGVLIMTGALFNTVLTVPWPAIVLILAGMMIGGKQIVQRGMVEARNLRPGMNFLMSVAVIGAMIINEWVEAGVVVFLFALAQWLEARSMDKARRSINSLMEKSPRNARIIDGQEFKEVPVEQVQVGDRVGVRPGEKIPVDGIVLEGDSYVDQSAITGESVPVKKGIDDNVYAGTLNKNGYLAVRTERIAQQSTYAKIIHLVTEAQSKKAPNQAFIEKFSLYYTPVVMILAFCVAVFPPLIMGEPFVEWFYRALVMLVIACPCALVISTPVTIVSALTSAMEKGVLIKGGMFLENFAKMNLIAFDKTGTLTEGNLRVQEIISTGSMTDAEILRIAATLESRSEHPIAAAITTYAVENNIVLAQIDNFLALDGKGIKGTVAGRTFYAGNHKLFEEKGWCNEKMHRLLERVEDARHTAVLVGSADNGVVGIISVNDTIRQRSAETVTSLRRNGLKQVVMLTGDNHRTAESVAKTVGVDEFYSELLPQDKVSVIDNLKEKGYRVAMVGDGVNDAPSLAAADIGIAMGTGSSDAALDTADIVLMNNDLALLPYLHHLSQKSLHIIKQNISIALGLKFIFLALAIPGLATLWMAVFADMGASLMVIFNGMRTRR